MRGILRDASVGADAPGGPRLTPALSPLTAVGGGYQPPFLHPVGSSFQGRQPPPLRGTSFGGRNLSNLYNGGEILKRVLPPCGARKTRRAYAVPCVFRPLRKQRPAFFCRRQRRGAVPPLSSFQLGRVKRIAALRCQWQSKQSRNFRSRTALRLEPSRRGAQTVFAARRSGRNRNLPPLVSFSFPLSLGQARERGSSSLCSSKEKMDTDQSGQRNKGGPPGASAPTRLGRLTRSAVSRPAPEKTKEARKKCAVPMAVRYGKASGHDKTKSFKWDSSL